MTDALYATLYAPPEPNWLITMKGDNSLKFVFHLKRGPNRFQRLMWRLSYGVEWEKLT